MNRQRLDEIWGSMYVEQKPEELLEIINRVEPLKPETILEIGVKQAGTLRFWEQLVPSGGLVIGVDIQPRIMWMWHTDRKIVLVVGDSASQGTVETVKEILGGRKVDFLFLDGKHDEDYPQKDFQNYSPLLRSGGLAVIADVGDIRGGEWYGGERDAQKAYEFLPAGRREHVNPLGKCQGMGCWWKP